MLTVDNAQSKLFIRCVRRTCQRRCRLVFRPRSSHSRPRVDCSLTSEVSPGMRLLLRILLRIRMVGGATIGRTGSNSAIFQRPLVLWQALQIQRVLNTLGTDSPFSRIDSRPMECMPLRIGESLQPIDVGIDQCYWYARRVVRVELEGWPLAGRTRASGW
jgi:hypothetical protein